MTPEEIYNLKRKNFIDQTVENFKYLVAAFGYSAPTHRILQQENGTIIADELEYENKLADRLVIISNAYHPVDYGFEICVYRPSILKSRADRKVMFFMFKEKQDVGQT